MDGRSAPARYGDHTAEMVSTKTIRRVTMIRKATTIRKVTTALFMAVALTGAAHATEKDTLEDRSLRRIVG